MDALMLSGGMALDVVSEVAGIETTDIGYAQLKVKDAKPVSDDKKPINNSSLWVTVGISALAVLVIAGILAILLLLKRKKVNVKRV